MSKQTQFIAVILIIAAVGGGIVVSKRDSKKDSAAITTASSTAATSENKKDAVPAEPLQGLPTKEIFFGKAKIIVELPQTVAEFEIGLGGRTSIPKNRGMLFVLENADFYEFWMKDMLFPIDIVWLDEAKKIVSIDRNISPDTYPKTFFPSSPAQYVLELPAGASTEYGVKIGDMIDF